jgi:hypothetical protein
MDLWYGLATGALFGVLLQRCEVLRYDRQLGALRLRDMTIVKFMLTTVVVGMIGVYGLLDLGLVKLSVKPAVLGGNIIGGLIFGLGWGLVGYCPGTAAGALGEGRLDAFWAILGMIVGAALYAEAYPRLLETVLAWGDLGKLTLPQVLGVNHWLVIGPFAVLVILIFRLFERLRL